LEVANTKMRRTNRALPNLCRCVFILCAITQLSYGQSATEETLTATERAFVASKIYSTLQLYFSSWKTEHGVEFDISYRTYLEKALTAESRREFDLGTMEFVAQLHNGHTFFWDAWLDKSDGQSLGFYARPLDGKWVVQTSFLENLEPGDIISNVEDTAIEAFFLQQRRYISTSSTAAQRHNLFLFPYLFPEQFTLTLESGRHVVVNRAIPSKPAAKTEGRWLKPGTIGYIRIPAFFSLTFEDQALDYLRQFHGAKVLLIDVRSNPGGITPVRLIQALMDRPYRGWAESAFTCAALFTADQGPQNGGASSSSAAQPRRSTDIPAARPGNLETAPTRAVIEPSRNAFRGRLILLVDSGCVSACEDLVEPSKASGRGILVGEVTQGSSGLPFFYDFHNGMTLRVAVRRDYFPDGSEFEGVGIKPDIEVHTTIEDLKNGRDPILEKALEFATRP
jgi:carboxyl-terminal processing protease